MRKMYNLPAKWIWFNNITGYLFRLKLTQIITKGKEIIQILSGITPLKLSNAVSKNIINLIQYGKVIQNGTPTPEAPVDIVCNNGTVTMVDDELPAGYKRVLGFSMKNNAYWEIPNFPMNGSDTLRFSFEATDSCNVIGAYSGSASGNNYSLYVSPTANYLRYKSGAYNSTVNFATRYDVEITPTGSSGMKVDSTWTAQTFTTPTNFCIGTTSVNASSAKLKGNLYGNIEVVGRAKFIPCERISDNVLGYYDLIGETFYMPTSGTPTSLGYDGSHCHLAVVGTPEVLTVGKNLFSQDIYLDAYCSAGGTITAHNSSRCFVMECKPNTEYRFIFDNSAISSPRCVINGFAAQPKIGMRSKQVCYSSSNTSPMLHDTTFTTDADVHYLVMWLMYQKSDTDTNAAVNNAVLMETATLQTATVPDLYAVGDYRDEVDVISGAVNRKVGVKVFDGTEDWKKLSGVNAYYTEIDSMKVCNPVEAGFSTHFIGTAAATSSMPNGSIKLTYTSTPAGAVSIRYNEATTVDDFKSWLAAQYAAGTPVIVIYPLAEETTEQVAGQPLRTTAGTNVVSVVSEVDPVELSVKYYTNK